MTLGITGDLQVSMRRTVPQKEKGRKRTWRKMYTHVHLTGREKYQNRASIHINHHRWISASKYELGAAGFHHRGGKEHVLHRTVWRTNLTKSANTRLFMTWVGSSIQLMHHIKLHNTYFFHVLFAWSVFMSVSIANHLHATTVFPDMFTTRLKCKFIVWTYYMNKGGGYKML